MKEQFSFKEALLNYRASGKMSRSLFNELQRLIRLVLYSKGVQAPSLQDEISGAFFEKLLKFKSTFYTRLELYHEGQVRSFLSMTVGSVLLDYYRREKQDRYTSVEEMSIGAKRSCYTENTWNSYKLEAQSLYQKIWTKLPVELQVLFCLMYSGGANVQQAAQDRGVSVGKIHKDKVRISQTIAHESSIEDVAQMVYRLIALEFCCQEQIKA